MNRINALLTLIAAIALAMAILAAGCGGQPATITPPPPATSLVGTWTSTNGDTTTTITIGCDQSITIATHVDGQADSSLVGQLDSSDGQLLLTQDGSALVLGTYTITGDVLTVGGSLEGVYSRVQAVTCQVSS
jgi:hypothetical protein